MMDTKAIEDAKKACLKQSFGGTLDSREQQLLTSYLETEEGTQYMNESDEMKNLLSDVAVVEPIDSTQMVREFEDMVRVRIQSARRNMPMAFVCTSGLWALVGTLCVTSGKDRLQVMGWGLLAMALLFVFIVIALWRKQIALLDSDDLIAEMEADRRLRKTTKVKVRGIVLSLIFLSALGYGVAEASGALGILAWVAFSTALLLLVGHFFNAQKRKDQKLWDWWEGR